ncbi:hypothetical protein Tco_1192960 [Tanacetum coccineum]
MAAGSKERPPMLGPGRYSQWHSRFLRYLDTKSNGEYLRKCIFDGPYMPTNVLIAAVEAAENILPVAAHEEVETIHNMTAENKLYFQAEKEAIFLILTGIGDEIYSTVDACDTAKKCRVRNRYVHISQAVDVLSISNEVNDNRSERLASTQRQRDRKPVTPQSESVSEEDSDPEQARRDKDMQKNLPSLQITVAGLKGNIGIPVAQKTGIRAINCKVKLDTMPGNAGSQSGLTTTRITRRKKMNDVANKLNTVFTSS